MRAPRCRLALLCCAGVPIALTSGCGSLGPDAGAAGAAASAFHAAARSTDDAAACALLAPGTREELEQSAGEPCPQALAEEQLPSAERVRDVAAYGRNARVVLDGDVVFLSVVDATWKVVAAGCRARPGRPYDCSVQGG